jgi:hypothetical protein
MSRLRTRKLTVGYSVRAGARRGGNGRMTTRLERPPKTGWAKLGQRHRSEYGILVRSPWVCDRPSATRGGVRVHERPEGAQIMLCQRTGLWKPPARSALRRGRMFQVYVTGNELIQRFARNSGVGDLCRLSRRVARGRRSTGGPTGDLLPRISRQRGKIFDEGGSDQRNRKLRGSRAAQAL